jgi:CRISPR/Cas system CSM-associated protein Csm4 (group 5 of RAMP superfamily)
MVLHMLCQVAVLYTWPEWVLLEHPVFEFDWPSQYASMTFIFRAVAASIAAWYELHHLEDFCWQFGAAAYVESTDPMFTGSRTVLAPKPWNPFKTLVAV